MTGTTRSTPRRTMLTSRVRRRAARDALTFLVFLAPFGVFYCLMKLWPIVDGFWISLHRWETIGTNISFIGLGN
jgi:multiple sugar transport system permease protein